MTLPAKKPWKAKESLSLQKWCGGRERPARLDGSAHPHCCRNARSWDFLLKCSCLSFSTSKRQRNLPSSGSAKRRCWHSIHLWCDWIVWDMLGLQYSGVVGYCHWGLQTGLPRWFMPESVLSSKWSWLREVSRGFETFSLWAVELQVIPLLRVWHQSLRPGVKILILVQWSLHRKGAVACYPEILNDQDLVVSSCDDFMTTENENCFV